MSLKKHFKFLSCLLFLTLLCFPALAAEYTVFGPQSYTRSSGSPITVTNTFTVTDTTGPFTLKLYNGGLEDDEAELVSSSEVYLNGVKIVSPNELNQKTAYLEKEITLNTSNTLEVELRGKPGGLLTLIIVSQGSIPALSVSVTPDNWPIGNVEPYSVVTTNSSQKITVLNDGTLNTTYSLKLNNPTGWQASQSAIGPDTYILNAAFSNDLSGIVWNEANHALSLASVLCSNIKFSGDISAVNVAPSQSRNLWFQFKAPASTSITAEQNIEVIVTAEPVN